MTTTSCATDLLSPEAFLRVFDPALHSAELLRLLNDLVEPPQPFVSVSSCPFTPPPSTRIPAPVLSLQARAQDGGEHVVLVLLYRELLPGMEPQLMWLASRALVEDMERRRTMSRPTPTTVLALCGCTPFGEGPPLRHFTPMEQQSGVSGYDLMPLRIVTLDLGRALCGGPPQIAAERWARHLHGEA